jgi:CelD/BcsL family acetyltransferase involved in cellulose biosynthesis
MEYQILLGIHSLDDIAAEYDTFVESNACDELLVLRRGYLKSLVPWLEQEARVFFVVVREDKKIIALAALQVIQRHWLNLKNRRLQFLGSQAYLLSFNYGGLISAPGVGRQQLLSIFWQALTDKQCPRWDEYYFDNLFESQRCVMPLDQSRHMPGQATADACHRMRLPESVDQLYSEKLSKNVVKRLRRCRRQLQQAFPDVRYQCLETLSESEYQQIAHLHSQRQEYKRQVKGPCYYSPFDSADEKQMIRDMLGWAADEHILRCYLLKVDDKVIAFSISLRFGNLMQSMIGAFDQAYKKYSPQKLLDLYCFEEEINRAEIKQVDVLSGANTLKNELYPDKVGRYILYNYNPFRLTARFRWFVISLLNRFMCFAKAVKSSVK